MLRLLDQQIRPYQNLPMYKSIHQVLQQNLVQLGTSMITNGHEKDLKLDPGTFSVNPDENSFNGSVSFECFFYYQHVSLCS